MALTSKQIALAERIDRWVKGVVSQGGGDADILAGSYDYMDTFKQLLDTTAPREIDRLCQQYEGFYRFAKLMELLAQGLADGVLDGLPGVKPRQAKKKRLRKPKPKRGQQQKKPQLIRRSIEYLPTFTELIIGSWQQTEEQYDSFVAARHKPHVLDDAIIDRAVRLYEEQLEGIPLFEQQLSWLLEDEISEAQRYQVEDLLGKLPTLQQKTEDLLALLAELRQGTINRIMEIDDEELGRRFLTGELGELGE